eukprot:GFUD01041090.1.p1 GENE.GFUD01041090.1~~GFUD01041090.1.p1  ORF type:complete len:385 (+),score=137.30 GFUD01041090.1:453-1607(+)
MMMFKSSEFVESKSVDCVEADGEDVETKPKSDYNDNIDEERPITIATPELINRRSFDQEQFMTPSATPVEEKQEMGRCDKIVKGLASAVAKSLQFLPVTSSSLPTTPGQVTTTPSPDPSFPPSQQFLGVTVSQSVQPPTPTLSHTPASTGPAAGTGKSVRPPQPRPGMIRQPVPRVPGPRPGMTQTVPVTRPPFRPGGPRMMRPPRPGMPRNSAPPVARPYYTPCRPGHPMTRAPLQAAGPRLPNVRSLPPTKHRSLSTPQCSSQYYPDPPVVEIDVSPPRSGQDCHSSLSPPSSVLNKLSSLGVSLERSEKVPTTLKHGWVLPPGLSIIKTTTEEGPPLSLPSLAQALLQLGEVGGKKRLVQLKLTEDQIMALDTLGMREEGL